MQDCTVYLITYKGQTESVYTWTSYTYTGAQNWLRDLSRVYPEREWDICEKDVS